MCFKEAPCHFGELEIAVLHTSEAIRRNKCRATRSRMSCSIETPPLDSYWIAVDKTVSGSTVAGIVIYDGLHRYDVGNSVDGKPPISCRLSGNDTSSVASSCEVGNASAAVWHLRVRRPMDKEHW
jgi:hypothetical protein